jgi:prepilin-type N-terminal cleavage/methylation domain-containing protein
MQQPRRRHGFTMVEIMVAIVLLSLVVGALLAVVVEQQRFYDGASEVMEVRDTLRRVGDLQPSPLRGVAPREGDIIAMSDSAIDVMVPMGSSVICTIDLLRTTITIPPTALGSDAGLSSWSVMPVLSDSILIFDSQDAMPDTLIGRTVMAALTAGACPTTSGFTATAAEAAAGRTIVLNLPLPPSVPVGAPIRFFRRASYSLFRQPSDRQWYLGYRDYVRLRAPQWSAVQAVAGPLLPYAATGATGLRFTYRDSVGTALSAMVDAPRVRSIDIEVRAQTATKVRTSGATRNATGHYGDSLRTSVALRNY